MTAYHLTRIARADLHEIWDYIARDSVATADRWTAKLIEACDRIGANPNIGHVRPDLAYREVRFRSVDDYVIAYRVKPSRVEILRVTHGSRVTSRYLRQRSR